VSSGLYVGLMSGTSMDGIDAVLVDLDDPAPRLIEARNIPWSATLRERLMAAGRGTYLTAAQFAALDAEVGEAFAQAALAVIGEEQRDNIRAIGSHGQTLAHAPGAKPGYTLQIGDPSRIAETTGITTVAGFRNRDIAAGGQGAPLVPAFHQAALGSSDEYRVILNIGGIANITCLPGREDAPVSGFDTGPGNCLMDAWISRQRGEPYDRDGAFAAQGEVQQPLLKAMLDDPYFALAPPKSTGTDYFSPAWLERQLGAGELRPQDVQATLSALTAHSIAAAISSHAADAQRVLACGGGAHNRQLMQLLGELLPCPLGTTAELGLDPDWVEAIAFAWLARQTLNGQPGNLPAVTGARGPRVLGAIHPA